MLTPSRLLFILLSASGLLFLRLSGPLGSSPAWSVVGYLIAFIAMLGIWKQFSSEPKPSRKSFFIIIALGLLFRVLFIGYPVSDDYHRYAWEGRMQTMGYNPYLVPPEAVELTPYRDNNWKGINHKEVAGIYPPVSMLLLRLLAPSYPSPELFRGVLILFDLATLFFLFALLRFKKKSSGALALYALNPFVIVFLIGEAHIDGLQVTFVTACLFLFLSKKFRSAFFALGLAFMSKYIALIFLPLLIHKKTLSKSWFFLLPLLLYIPFLQEGLGLFTSLKVFTTHFTFNSPLFFFFQQILGEAAHWAILFLFMGVGGLHLLIEPRIEKNFFFISLLFLTLSPTVHPWYLILSLPFALLIEKKSFFLLLTTTFLFLLPLYTRNHITGIWAEYAWSKWVIWVPFWILYFLEGHQKKEFKKDLQANSNTSHQKALSFSLVIPTWNEAQRIYQVITDLKQLLDKSDYEIIVIDAGSTDNTLSIAKNAGAKVFLSPQKGRGFQLLEGLNKATKEYTFFLHADCQMEAKGFTSLQQLLHQNPKALGGWHLMSYSNNKSLKLKFIQFLNNFRARFMGIAFGDQLQWVQTEKAKKESLLAPMPLMEDVYLSLAIKSKGSFILNPVPIQVSSRKWNKASFGGNAFLIIRLVFLFLLQIRLGLFNSKDQYFVRKYYKN